MTGRNVLFAVIGALVVVAIVGGYVIYQDRQTSGIDLTVGNGGISVTTK